MVTSRLVIHFTCRKCKVCHGNVEDQEEQLYNDMEAVTDFSYLGDIIN